MSAGRLEEKPLPPPSDSKTKKNRRAGARSDAFFVRSMKKAGKRETKAIIGFYYQKNPLLSPEGGET